MKFFILFFLFFLAEKIYTFSPKELIENVRLYTNELCSFNGIPKINTTTNEVICECKERYANEPRKDKIKYINGQMIQCSYERKSRFYTIFLSACFPFGFDFLYLKRYYSFCISFIMSLTTLSLNIIVFVINYKINIGSKETKIQIRFNKMVNKAEDKKNNEDKKSFNTLKLFCKIFTILHVSYMIIVLILHSAVGIKDGNNVDQEDDLGYLFLTPEEE